jgi:hypothetical protein
MLRARALWCHTSERAGLVTVRPVTGDEGAAEHVEEVDNARTPA